MRRADATWQEEREPVRWTAEEDVAPAGMPIGDSRASGRGPGNAGSGRKHLRIPLQAALVALLASEVLLAVGLVAYLSLHNARAAVNDVAKQLRSEVTTRVEERLREFLATPHVLNDVNAELIGRGVLDADNPEELTAHFWQQVQAAPTVSSAYFGNTKGGVADAGREGAGGPLYVIVTDGFAAGTFRKYATNDVGVRTSQLQAVPGFDARTRSWYTRAMTQGGPAWSSIYLLFSGQDMAISASRPVANGRGEAIGVVAADLFLSQVGDFLRGVKIGMSGRCFIMERSGLLIASSADETPIVFGEGGRPPRRLAARESSSPMIRAAAATIEDDGGVVAGGVGGQWEFSMDGERHFLQVATIRDGYGIDWLVGVAIPERDFMVRVDANTRTTIALILGAALIAVTFGLVASRWVTLPMSHLGRSARALAGGERQVVAETSRIAEVADLSRSFNVMTQQLERTVESLQAEVAERRRAEEELRASEARYRLLADNSTDVIWTMDRDGVLTYVSPSIEKLRRGVAAESVLGHPFTIGLTAESAAAAGARFAAVRDMVARGIRIPPEEHIELELDCLDGSTVWTESVVSPLIGDDGEVRGFIGMSRNITARRHAEEERLALEAQLRHSQKLESIGTLASGVAHEINNPLTGVINYADLIARRVGDLQLREFAEGIKVEGNRMAEIVGGLLSFARQETTEKRKEQMPDIVRASLTLVGSILRKDRIHLKQSMDSELPLVRCNAQQIEQIIINLLTNARDALNRKYPGEDEDKIVEIAIRLVEKSGEPWVRTTVEDHGSGVPADLMARIFDPFFTTKPRDMGTGLGLSISYGIARDHGGALTVESVEGLYTRFHLDLRAAD
ncbi:MAG: cache domain-containing protein [Candidatus Bipolaricaulis sp.]|nr:cache domain-containing protein [Candidatus Bipolaricaulis sp.]